MSMFGDYKAYKKYEPTYNDWKYKRDYIEAQRQQYIKNNPASLKESDIQRGRNLLRAIDIMDEYSQQKAEDAEVATEPVVGNAIDLSILGGSILGVGISKIKPINNFLTKQASKNKLGKNFSIILAGGLGAVAGIISAFPLYAWAAKVEIGASRRGRFEAMRNELDNPNAFAVLNNDQKAEVEKIAQNISIPKKKKNTFGLGESLRNIKDLAFVDKKYKKQKALFDVELSESEKHINDKMSPEEIEKAKKDQQLLTKLVEKIDIASQDYAENAELFTSVAVAAVTAIGMLTATTIDKFLTKLNPKTALKISASTKIASIVAPIILAISSAQIQKEASRVGRYKIKQELLNNPNSLAYISDDKIKDIKNINVEQTKKENMFTFLKNAWKNQKEYNKYKKTKAQEDEKIFKAMEKIKLTPEQLEDAKRLQRNTFKTFNKVDEKSQKYSESIEALGQALSLPITLICTGLGCAYGMKIMNKANPKNKLDMISKSSQYIGTILLSAIPSIGINAYITKKQKRASRIADMLAINELSDYRKFK